MSNQDLTVQQRIEQFKGRVAFERPFCEELFQYATVRLLAHKYAYYILNDSYLNDYAFDIEEKSWYIMGRALELLSEDETSPCIDFDPEHKLAAEGIALALKLVRK
jgi:hypothetical protein